MEKGYVQVYTGNGKGKTTAALGQAFRAVGQGMKVIVIQFFKGIPSGEMTAAQRLDPDMKILRFERNKKFFWQLNEKEKKELREDVQKALEYIMEVLNNHACDMLILDEIMAAIHGELVSVDQVIQIIEAKPSSMELILTGRNVPREIAARADLVTEMKPVKHYYEKRVAARRGIEY
ncbi:MAG: cob(I)yrinic acid a,c-diamide adenosyltransferase [Clostridia bacterium]|jgi:cob(I)alamin adenosyltransferase